MNEEIKAQWLAALRSGEYSQGRYNLRTENAGVAKYCCLGVLCDLAEKAGIVKSSVDERGITRYQDIEGYEDPDHATLPQVVMDWSGVETSEGQIPGESSAWLAERNDHGLPFEEIAKIIEERF